MNGETELVHRDESGRIDGRPSRGEAGGIAGASSIGETALRAPAGGGLFSGGHLEGGREPACV